MDIEFSEQQRMIQDSARGFLEDAFTGPLVREARQNPQGCSQQNWQEMAELGLMGIRVPEVYDGIAGSFAELIVLLEEMGRVAMPGPFFSTAVYAVEILTAVNNQKINQLLLPRIASGQIKLAVAIGDDDGDISASAISITASPDKGGYSLDGTIGFVPNAQSADYVLCAARMGRSECPQNDIALFCIAANTTGLGLEPLNTMNGLCAGRLVLDDVHVTSADLISDSRDLWSFLEPASFRSAVAKCAEMVGAASRILEIATAYAKERQQFGQAIGRFQAIQHHCADMLTDLDCARWMTFKTGWLIDEGRATRQDMAMTKAWCSQACRRILRNGHQVMGGIGYCEEHDMPLFFRYIRMAEAAMGGADEHMAIIASDVLCETEQTVNQRYKE